jgi:hypothetical protein
MGHATITDVETVLLRELTDPETDLASKMLMVAAGMLRQRVPGLEDRMTTDLDFADRVNYVESKAVARALRNPEGITYETIGPFAAQRPQQSVGEDGVSFTKSELALLGVGSGAFTIRPHMARPVLGVNDSPPPWFLDFPNIEGNL